MKIHHFEEIEPQVVDMEGATGCHVRWLVGEKDGAPNFAMRQFEVGPGGHTPRHHHPYEHEIFVLEGQGEVVQGEVVQGEQRHPLKAGDVLLIEPDEVHQFRNTGRSELKFLCLIPNSAAGRRATVVPECGTDPAAS